MGLSRRVWGVGVLCVVFAVAMVSCSKEQKVGTVEITQTKFFMEKDGNVSQSLNVKGIIKNIGPYDVKNVVIAGRCKSCSEVMASGKWFVTQTVKTDDQKDAIGYLAAGAQEPFSFNDIAYYYDTNADTSADANAVTPDKYPDGLEVYIESFETVQE